ncbi:MAG: hypothetical protein ABIT38_21580 [Gemmatimonadaceae bacterium]
MTSLSRRDALRTLAATIGAQLLVARIAGAQSEHPEPRAGITAEKLPSLEQLADTPDAIPVFNMVREIPGVVDGIRCNCGCADKKDFYSLLSCYEGNEAMAKHCGVCQGQGRLAYRLHKAGKSLDEIRKGIDARFG